MFLVMNLINNPNQISTSIVVKSFIISKKFVRLGNVSFACPLDMVDAIFDKTLQTNKVKYDNGKYLNFTPSNGIKVPQEISDILNSKLRKKEIENVNERIVKYNQDPINQNNLILEFPTKPKEMVLLLPAKPKEMVLPLPTKSKEKVLLLLIKIKDKGFIPSTDDFKRPVVLDKAIATADDRKDYNAQMTKFNQDQVSQLNKVQALAKNKYSNAKANKYNHLGTQDLTDLGALRELIANKTNNDVFITKFMTLRRQDLKAETKITNRKIKQEINRISIFRKKNPPIIPFSPKEISLLKQDQDEISDASSSTVLTQAVNKFTKDYNDLLVNKNNQLKILIKKTKKENKIMNFGFTGPNAPKLPMLSSEENLTDDKLENYKIAVTKFNLYQNKQKIMVKENLKKLKIDESHVVKENIEILRKAKKKVENAIQGITDSTKLAKLYKNFYVQYADSAKILSDSKTSGYIKIIIPSVSGLLIIILLAIVVRLKINKKRLNNLGDERTREKEEWEDEWENDEAEEWEVEEVDEWADDEEVDEWADDEEVDEWADDRGVGKWGDDEL